MKKMLMGGGRIWRILFKGFEILAGVERRC